MGVFSRVHDMDTTGCRVFFRTHGLDPKVVHRFVVGEDPEARAMSADEAAAELGDPFATLVLLEGTFPGTAEEVVQAVVAAAPAGDKLHEQMSFVLGEGSQIPVNGAPASLDRGLRFVVTLGASSNGPPEGPDVFVSAFSPEDRNIELAAWDRKNGGFNYYRGVLDPDTGAGPAWLFTGNSRHALSEPTQGKGPFQSHKSGALLMKELKLPWINWDSPNARIVDNVFAPNDPVRKHPWFTKKEPGGAYALELAAMRPAIDRWAKARFEALLAGGGAIGDPARIMEQILGTATVNLFSSRVKSQTAGAATSIDLPSTFFVDADGLGPLGLDGPPQLSVAGNLYVESLRKFDVRLEGDDGTVVRKGDTHFAFLVPERAFEDQVVLQQAVEVGLVTKRLAASLLMTDFPNPVFSDRRAALLAHVPATAEVKDGASTFSQEMADAILAAAGSAPADSPEHEFAERWNVGDDFVGPFNALLAGYYAAVAQRLETQGGFDDYFRLAESRRERVRGMPIFENELLFARTNIPPAVRAMRPDGSVA
jgi:hypothetical protein